MFFLSWRFFRHIHFDLFPDPEAAPQMREDYEHGKVVGKPSYRMTFWCGQTKVNHYQHMA
jgi:hypothetical protein